MKIFSWIKNIDRQTIIRNSFLLPILSVVAMSISHVISWYGLGNPFSWAIYLSIAVEVFALASVSAASIKMKKGSIWLLFILVTLIQIIGNVFFTYQFIDIESISFKSWVELVNPWFEDWNMIDHRRLLALVQGGTLPFMSLIALHFYIKFNENLDSGKNEKIILDPQPDLPVSDPDVPETDSDTDDVNDITQTTVENDTEETETVDNKFEEIENNEKKTESDQIHITDKPSRNRRRLHPASY